MHRTLSSTSTLAVNAMIDLALQSQTRPVALSVIGLRREVSKSYLDQLFGRLRRHALVRATRGPGGGYSLGRDAGQISVADIVVAIDRPGLATGRGKARAGQGSAGQCLAYELWNDLDARLMAWLGAISLQALVDERRARDASIELAAPGRAIASAPAARPIEVNAPRLHVHPLPRAADAVW